MSSKLRSLKKKANKRIELPYPDGDIASHVTVMLRKDGRIELYGAVEDEQFCTSMLALGIKRAQQWHAQKRASDGVLNRGHQCRWYGEEHVPGCGCSEAEQGEAAPLLSGSEGEPGAEAAGNGEAVLASPLPSAIEENELPLVQLSQEIEAAMFVPERKVTHFGGIAGE